MQRLARGDNLKTLVIVIAAMIAAHVILLKTLIVKTLIVGEALIFPEALLSPVNLRSSRARCKARRRPKRFLPSGLCVYFRRRVRARGEPELALACTLHHALHNMHHVCFDEVRLWA